MKKLMPALLGLSFILTGCSDKIETLRIGYCPNLTHAAAIVGVFTGRWARIGKIPVRASVYSAGPSEVQALMYKDLDIALIGPVPALSLFVKSKGEYVVISGAAMNGAVLVLAKNSRAKDVEGLRESRVATPQSGNTQDVAARVFFGERGFVSYEQGGGFQILPTANQDLASMFDRDEIDAVWTVEPWATQLIEEKGGKQLVDETQLWGVAPATGPYLTAVVVARKSLVKRHPEIVDEFLKLHVETTEWLKANPGEAQRVVEEMLTRLTRRPFKEGVIAKAWKRVLFTTDVPVRMLELNQANAARVGFLTPEPVDMKKLVDLAPLERAQRRGEK